MDVREKLVELIYRAHHNASCVIGYDGSEGEAIEEEARYLLANGVTVLPHTNGDRIRAMTDEELAKWIDGMYCECVWCDVRNPNCSDMECTECIEIWLKQPPKEE